jgi:hypothetical protein
MEAFNKRFDTAVQTGALEAEAASTAVAAVEELQRRVALKIALPKPQFAGTPKDIRSANLEGIAPSAPAPAAAAAALADGGARKKMATLSEAAAAPEELNFPAVRQRYAVLGKAVRDEDAKPEDSESAFYERQDKSRAEARRFFQKLDKTQEWAENNYWHLPIEQQVADLVKANAFWGDYAAHDGKTPFLSKAFPETATTFTEMMLALAVLDLPFQAGKHAEKVEGVGYTLQAASPLLLFHREISGAARGGARRRAGGAALLPRRRPRAGGERRALRQAGDRRVPAARGVRRAGGADQPTGSRQKLHALLQIPVGAVPAQEGFYTRGIYLVLEPYSTQTREYFFYFPATATFRTIPSRSRAASRSSGARRRSRSRRRPAEPGGHRVLGVAVAERDGGRGCRLPQRRQPAPHRPRGDRVAHEGPGLFQESRRAAGGAPPVRRHALVVRRAAQRARRAPRVPEAQRLCRPLRALARLDASDP